MKKLLSTDLHTSLNLVKVSKHDMITAMNHVNNCFSFYKKNDRTDDIIKRDIFYGKLAEFAFKNIFLDKVSVVNISNERDEGYDFMFENKVTVDVKFFGYKENHSCVMLGKGFKADYYAAFRLMNINDNEATFDYYGMCEGVKARQRKSKIGSIDNENENYVSCSLFDLNIEPWK